MVKEKGRIFLSSEGWEEVQWVWLYPFPSLNLALRWPLTQENIESAPGVDGLWGQPAGGSRDMLEQEAAGVYFVRKGAAENVEFYQWPQSLCRLSALSQQNSGRE